MLKLGIDEATIVIQLTQSLKDRYTYRQFDWPIVAENLITEFTNKADFETIYGEKMPITKCPEGYTNSFTFGTHSYFLAVSYHYLQPSMGVVIKFSAQALDYYCKESGFKLYELLQNVQSTDYTTRLSRIDLTADYFDEGINVSTIYKNLINEKIGTYREVTNKSTGELSYRRTPLKCNGIVRESDVPTLYLGSRKSNAFLRIYDKKREQIETKGNKLDDALRSTEWTRFEAVLRHAYAHQLTDELLKIQSDDELANLIACTILQKYRFMYLDNGTADYETEYSQMLLDCISNKNFILRSPTSRNFELAKNINYILGGSGVMSSLYKIKEIWGEQGVSVFMIFINELLAEFKPNDDCRYWLKKNKDDYQKNFPDFDLFFKEGIINGMT